MKYPLIFILFDYFFFYFILFLLCCYCYELYTFRHILYAHTHTERERGREREGDERDGEKEGDEKETSKKWGLNCSVCQQVCLHAHTLTHIYAHTPAYKCICPGYIHTQEHCQQQVGRLLIVLLGPNCNKSASIDRRVHFSQLVLGLGLFCLVVLPRIITPPFPPSPLLVTFLFRLSKSVQKYANLCFDYKYFWFLVLVLALRCSRSFFCSSG